ncbi:hypothetical protein ACOJTA_05660 [Malaciobacter sp. WC5094]
MFKLSPLGVKKIIKKSLFKSKQLTYKERLHINTVIDMFFEDYSFDDYILDFDLFFDYQHTQTLSIDDQKEFDRDLYRIYNQQFKNNVIAYFEDVK